MVDKVFNKRKAQILAQQLYCFITVLKAYCDKKYFNEDMESIFVVLNHIIKLADSLYAELDTWEVRNIDYE